VRQDGSHSRREKPGMRYLDPAMHRRAAWRLAVGSVSGGILGPTGTSAASGSEETPRRDLEPASEALRTVSGGIARRLLALGNNAE